MQEIIQEVRRLRLEIGQQFRTPTKFDLCRALDLLEKVALRVEEIDAANRETEG